MVCPGCAGSKKVKVKVNREKCVGCGMCASVLPNIFELVDGKARAKEEVVSLCEVAEVAENCPVGAIEIEEI